MTKAPDNLLAARKLLLDHLGQYGLSGIEVGIVGDAAHIGQGNSYHLGLPEQASSGYAATESPRDKAGLCEYASALDVGEFDVRGRYNLRHFSAWLVAQCKANTADTRDIREVIYSLDGSTVRRWDRLGKRSTGDSSHRWHTHISFFRDSTKAGRDLTPLFRRYLTTIGLLEDDMTPDEVRTQVALGIYDALHIAASGKDFRGLKYSGTGAIGESIRANLAAIVALGADTDEQAIVAGVLAGLSPQAIAAAIPTELARQVADELARRMAD